jgi:hypothetical protein
MITNPSNTNHVCWILRRPFGAESTLEESTEIECDMPRRLRLPAVDPELSLIKLNTFEFAACTLVKRGERRGASGRGCR